MLFKQPNIGPINSAETVVFLDASVIYAGKILQKAGKEQGHIRHGFKEFSHDRTIVAITKHTTWLETILSTLDYY